MDLQLTNRSVIVTGAASGIGRACTKAFASEGARVLAADLDGAGVASLETEHRQSVRAHRTDVRRPRDVEQLFAAADGLFGDLDVLVAAAGVFHGADIEDIGADDWDQTQSVNVRGAFLCAQAAISRMKRRGAGSIVLVASMAGRDGGIYAGADYVASKGAVIALTKALARQFAANGVRVNCVNPGVIDTPMTRAFPSDVRERIAASHPMRRWGRTEEVTPIILLLASPLSSYMTGAQIDVNGGAAV